jgi:hypothetical protein
MPSTLERIREIADPVISRGGSPADVRLALMQHGIITILDRDWPADRKTENLITYLEDKRSELLADPDT